MQGNHEGHNEETANGLLLLVSGDGIPLLVRTYGEVHTPPSAAVGIVSALYHAAKREKSDTAEGTGLRLQALESAHRTIVYEAMALDFLLVFASDKPRNACNPYSSTRRMLRTVFAALSMLVGERNLRNWDSSRLRAAIAKQMEVVDAIVTRFRDDARLIFGRPVCDALAHWQLDEGDIGDDKRLLQGMWLDNGVLVGEFSRQDSPARLNAGELLILIITGECVARRDCDYAYHVARVNVASIQVDVKMVICNSSRAPLTTFIGVFTDQTVDDEALRKEAERLLLCHAKLRASPSSSIPARKEAGQLEGLPDTLICSYASRMGDVASPSCRALAYLNPSWKTAVMTEAARLQLFIDAGKTPSSFWWRELCQFADCRLAAATSNRSVRTMRSSDFKREDEALTFLYHIRGPVQFVSICVGPVDLQGMVDIGDALAAAMLAIK